ncbi:MAG: hypothetical protein AAB209_04430, partial [Bacteroidota bacterium]
MRKEKRFGLMLFVIAATVVLQWDANAQMDGKKKLDEAMKFYNSANFDKAIELFSRLADDKTIGIKDKKEILLSLGRSYVAKGDKKSAGVAMMKLIALEPPIIEPDPDAECPPLM